MDARLLITIASHDAAAAARVLALVAATLALGLVPIGATELFWLDVRRRGKR